MQIRNVPAGTYALVLGDDISAMNTAKIYLQCQTNDGAINILLPKITDVAGGLLTVQNWWFQIFVNDVDGNAATNNITITPNPADTINGGSSQMVLNTNGATGCLNITGRTSWEFSFGASSNSIQVFQASHLFTPTEIQNKTKVTMTPTPPSGKGALAIAASFDYTFVTTVYTSQRINVFSNTSAGVQATTTDILDVASPRFNSLTILDTSSGSTIIKNQPLAAQANAVSVVGDGFGTLTVIYAFV